ncbi:MAG: hypothetical protein U0R68_11595 [Candidatus Nanopelagicales bacterium]
MARLRVVEAWPSTRHPDRPWHEDPDVAAFLGSSRGIFDLYSAELPAAEQTAKASSIRFFMRDVPSPDGFALSLNPRFLGSFDMAGVTVPTGFADRPAERRAAAALDVVHAAVIALAGLRGWDAARLDEVRDRAVAQGLRFCWCSGWKSAPGRRHQARGVYWLDAEGDGHVQLEIRATDGTIVARSDPALAFMTSEGFRRSAATLRWQDSSTVALVPWAGLLGDDGLVVVDVHGPVAELGVPGPVHVCGTPTEVAVAVETGEEWADDPELPWAHLEGIDAVGTGAYWREFQRVSDVLGDDDGFRAWWSQAPFRTLRMRLSVPDPAFGGDAPRPGSRKSGEDLVLQVVVERAGLPLRDTEALRAQAREDLHAALVDLAVSRKLAAPPPLPAGIESGVDDLRIID